MVLLALTTVLLISGAYSDDQQPLVKTSLGEVRGYQKISHDGRKFSAFEGIPYAKPPVGERRFKEPEPAEPWKGTWNATTTSLCAQTIILQGAKTAGAEDCLHVNVYVARENLNPEENLDVIVHIHGGAFMYGSGNAFSPPDSIMDKEVVYVTFNYRLGILGFLSTEDDVVPGNNGLKDQSMALRWVQRNIASFGGNPNSVTLTGLSAGSSSVHLHYFSDLSRGLFHKGLSQSGVALSPFAIQEKPLIKTRKLAAAVGCPTDNTRLLVACLRQIPFEKLLAQVPSFFSYMLLPCAPFGPVVERRTSKPFLKKNPYVLLKRGHVYDVPWIASTVIHEGLFPVIFFMNDLDYIDKNWEELAPGFLEFNNTLSPSLWRSTAEKIKEFYLGSKKISNETMMDLVQLFTDRYFAADTETSVRMQAKANKSPVYYYVFGYPGDNNPQKLVGHGGDAKYFYGPMLNAPGPFKTGPLTPNELKMRDLVLNMLTEYAKTGKPVFGNVDWGPSHDDQLTYLAITGVEPGQASVKRTDNLNNRNFWNSLGLAEGEFCSLRKNNCKNVHFTRS